jgi:predicted Zn finger-like uncharacterized protein
MFTTCPSCRMNLAVTVADLRVGQGYVRCGRCERVFNSLMSLAEDMDPEDQSGLAAHGTASMPALEVPEEDAVAPDPVVAQELLERAPLDVDLDVMDSAETGTVETIVLEGDTYTQVEEHVDEEEVMQRLRDITGEPDPDKSAAPEPEPEPDPAPQPPPPAAQPAEFDADAAVGNAPRRHWGWAVAIVALLLLLTGQVVHYYRQALVAKPWLEQPLRWVYGLFGVALEPAWDLAAYDLIRLGGEPETLNSTTLVLRASVHNRAPSAQPPPLIRVRLQDRYGNTLSTTAVPPADYLKTAPPLRLAADQRLDVELRLEDPNRQAMGWELDACLPGSDGALHCAHDP